MKHVSPAHGAPAVLGAEVAQPGTRLAHFELLEQLGVGGFAVVYRARDLRHERDVALKVLLPSAQLRVPDIQARFHREIALLQRLSHPNIVRFFEHGEADGGQLWLSMELVVGRELSSVLAARGAMAPSRALAIVRQILSALSEPHAQQIVHRDLKPGNVMLTSAEPPHPAGDDVVKLLDFGTGKALGASEVASVQDLTLDQHNTTGTPRYMAIEQISNDSVGPFTDVYAVCVILIEMLTGAPAVRGSSAYEILTRLISQPLELPDWLERCALGPVLRRGTSREGLERYADAMALLDALDGLDVAALDACWHEQRRVATNAIRTGPQPAASELDTDRVPRPRAEHTADIVVASPDTTDADADAPARSHRRNAWLAAGLVVVVLGAAGVWAWSSSATLPDSAAAETSPAERPRRPVAEPTASPPPLPAAAPVLDRAQLERVATSAVDAMVAAAAASLPRSRSQADEDAAERRESRRRRRRERAASRDETKTRSGKDPNPFAIETH